MIREVTIAKGRGTGLCLGIFFTWYPNEIDVRRQVGFLICQEELPKLANLPSRWVQSEATTAAELDSRVAGIRRLAVARQEPPRTWPLRLLDGVEVLKVRPEHDTRTGIWTRSDLKFSAATSHRHVVGFSIPTLFRTSSIRLRKELQIAMTGGVFHRVDDGVLVDR